MVINITFQMYLPLKLFGSIRLIEKFNPTAISEAVVIMYFFDILIKLVFNLDKIYMNKSKIQKDRNSHIYLDLFTGSSVIMTA